MLANEIVERPSLEQQDRQGRGLRACSRRSNPTRSSAIDYLDQARKAAEAAKNSTAPWDLAELALRIARGEVAEADRLLHHIRDEHIREPGVAQALFQILSEAGIIGPDGKPTARAAAARRARASSCPARAAAEPGKIWTPGSDQPQRQEVGTVDARRLARRTDKPIARDTSVRRPVLAA